MNGSNSYTKKQKTLKSDKSDDLSKNHKRTVRYRIRLQEDAEALNDIKQFKDKRGFRRVPEQDDFGDEDGSRDYKFTP